MNENEKRKLALEIAYNVLDNFEYLDIVEQIEAEYSDLDEEDVDKYADDVKKLISDIKLSLPSTNIM